MDKDYEAGIRDGKLDALAKEVNEHKAEASKRITELETAGKSRDKIIWMLIGAFALLEIVPNLREFLG